MFDDINNLNDSITEHKTLSDLHSLLVNYTDIGKINDELKNHHDACKAQQTEFETTLSKEQRTLYNRLSDNERDEVYILTQQAFIYGYKMATRLLLESMK